MDSPIIYQSSQRYYKDNEVELSQSSELTVQPGIIKEYKYEERIFKEHTMCVQIITNNIDSNKEKRSEKKIQSNIEIDKDRYIDECINKDAAIGWRTDDAEVDHMRNRMVAFKNRFDFNIARIQFDARKINSFGNNLNELSFIDENSMLKSLKSNNDVNGIDRDNEHRDNEHRNNEHRDNEHRDNEHRDNEHRDNEHKDN